MKTKVAVIATTALAAMALVALAAAANPGVTVLARRATQLLHAKPLYRKAVFLEAAGSPAKRHPVTTAGQIVKWHLVFDNHKTGNKYKTVSINIIRNLLGAPKGSTTAFLQDQPINTIPKMTLTRAVHLLNGAGWTKGFFAVTLRKPDYPGVENAEYVFAMVGGKIVAVDTQTGKVSKLS